MSGDPTSHSPLAEPPEGAIRGESVPPASEPDNYDETFIQDLMGALKARGEPYISMSESELRERAVETAREYGVEW